MGLKELTKEYLTKEVYHTPLSVLRLMGEMLNPKGGRLLDLCGGSQEFLKRAGMIWPAKGEEELLAVENWTGAEETCESRENLLLCGPREAVENYLEKERSGEEGYDFILLNPPFGYAKGMAKSEGTRLEGQFLKQAAECLKAKGRCAAVVPNGLLTRTSRENVGFRKWLVEGFHVEQVVFLPLSSFLPFAEVSTGILVFSKEKGNGITSIFDLRKEQSPEILLERYQKAEPVCVLNRAALLEHQYLFSPEEYVRNGEIDEQSLSAKEKRLKRQLKKLKTHIPSVYENEEGQIGIFPCERGIQMRRSVLREILDCEYELLECDLIRTGKREKWPRRKGSLVLELKSGKRWVEDEKDGPYPVYGAAGVQGTAKSPSMERDTALLIGRVGSYCGAVYKAWNRGFVSDNVMVAEGKKEAVEEDFLLLLLKAAHFNGEKRGSVQPYITKDVILKRDYLLPGLDRQLSFLEKNREVFRQIKEQEREVENLSLEVVS